MLIDKDILTYFEDTIYKILIMIDKSENGVKQT